MKIIYLVLSGIWIATACMLHRASNNYISITLLKGGNADYTDWWLMLGFVVITSIIFGALLMLVIKRNKTEEGR